MQFYEYKLPHIKRKYSSKILFLYTFPQNKTIDEKITHLEEYE